MLVHPRHGSIVFPALGPTCLHYEMAECSFPAVILVAYDAHKTGEKSSTTFFCYFAAFFSER